MAVQLLRRSLARPTASQLLRRSAPLQYRPYASPPAGQSPNARSTKDPTGGSSAEKPRGTHLSSDGDPLPGQENVEMDLAEERKRRHDEEQKKRQEEANQREQEFGKA